MRIRTGFVSNSSSTAFLITNTSGRVLSAKDFAVEVAYLVDMFNNSYDYSYTEDDFIKSAEYNDDWDLQPGESRVISYGDEDGTTVGHVLDYMLREGGSSPSFTWEFHHWER